MINRVNKAPLLRLVTAQAKQSENDPGSSQGSGMAYDGPPSEKKEEPQEAKAELAPQSDEAAEVIPIEKKAGKSPIIKSLNAVYEEFFKRKKNAPSVGLTTQYADDHSSAKGMLLNKKAE